MKSDFFTVAFHGLLVSALLLSSFYYWEQTSVSNIQAHEILSAVEEEETVEPLQTFYDQVEINVESTAEETKCSAARKQLAVLVALEHVTPVTGYTQTDNVKVYTSKSKDSKVVYTLSLNEKVKYYDQRDGWFKLTGLNQGFVKSTYIDDTKYVPFKLIQAPSSNGCKTMESYRVFRQTGSNLTNQGKLQTLAETDELGFRKVGNRYCIAVGSAVCDEIGTCIDLVLDNGVVIPCVMGDQKADRDTDSSHFKTRNGCMSEFIVDLRKINTTYGDVSYVQDAEDWMSPVVEFKVYEKNILKEQGL